MKPLLYIVSGFLGVGKTTFIQKLLDEIGGKKRILIIENDFGALNFDGTMLRQKGFEVRELTSGCICCNLSGDFKETLKDVIQEVDVDLIIVEPSGVGKLSEIQEACASDELKELIVLKKSITIVDADRSPLYARNFGEFFRNQVAHSDLIFVSHLEGAFHLDKTKEIIREYNKKAPIITTPWAETNILSWILKEEVSAHSVGETDSLPSTPKSSDHEVLGDFETLTVSLTTKKSYGDYEKIMQALSMDQAEGGPHHYGYILRMKGLAPLDEKEKKTLIMQYASAKGELEKTGTLEAAYEMTFIGHDLDKEAIFALWGMDGHQVQVEHSHTHAHEPCSCCAHDHDEEPTHLHAHLHHHSHSHDGDSCDCTHEKGDTKS